MNTKFKTAKDSHAPPALTVQAPAHQDSSHTES